jgi:hypothetical protein
MLFELRMVRIKHTAHPRVLSESEIMASEDVAEVHSQQREDFVEMTTS